MNPRRLTSLVPVAILAAGLCLGAPTLRAETTPPAIHQHQEAPSPEHKEGSGEAHATTHHGPEIKLFGSTLGMGGQFLVKLFNFAILAGGLFFLLKGALSTAFKARAKELRESLDQAAKDKAESEAQLRDLDAKMASLQSELQEILNRTEAEAQGERDRILASARSEAEAILARAQSEIEHLKHQAGLELRALVAELAAEGASRRLEAKLQGALASEVLDKAIDHVGGAK